MLITLVLVAHNTVVDIKIIHPQRTVFFKFFDIDIVCVDETVRLNPLRTRFIIKVVFTLQSLVSFDSLLKFKLHFGVLGLKL